MKYHYKLAGCIFCLAMMLPVPELLAQDQQSKDDMMAKMQQYMTPGPGHKKLESMVGFWDVKAEAWMNGPGQAPSASKGTAQYEMVFGGRYLREVYTGDMMGEEFHGEGFTGYDNFKKKYVGMWIDDMGTSISTMEGDFDPDGKVMTMWGKMDDPASGAKDQNVKYVTTMKNKDTFVFEIYGPPAGGGDPYLMMRLTYTRKL